MANNIQTAKAILSAMTSNPATTRKGNIIPSKLWPGNQWLIQNGSMTPARQMIYDLAMMIKQERIKQGMTQRDLARKSGFSQGTITRLETRMWVSMNCIINIINALGKKITLT